MSPRTTLTLANGRGVDLANPVFFPTDFPALAEQLAKEARYNGATPGVQYSVAEHCVLGADAILAERGKFISVGDGDEIAAYFLMHDLHEALIKDVTTPLKALVADIAQENFGVLGDAIVQTFKLIEYRLDAALHDAAGLQWPPPSSIIPVLKTWDKIMFVTEWRDLMGGRGHPDWAPYAVLDPLQTTIRAPWPWHLAKAAWLRRARQLLPALKRAAA